MIVIGLNPGGLSGAESSVLMEQFAAQTGASFPIGWDAVSYGQFRGAAGSGVSPFPVDVIIAPDGTLAWVSREYEAGAMQAVIEGLLP